MKFSELLENTIKSFEQDLDLKIYAEFLKRIPIQNFSEAPAAVSKSTLYINKDWFDNHKFLKPKFNLLKELIIKNYFGWDVKDTMLDSINNAIYGQNDKKFADFTIEYIKDVPAAI